MYEEIIYTVGIVAGGIALYLLGKYSGAKNEKFNSALKGLFDDIFDIKDKIDDLEEHAKAVTEVLEPIVEAKETE